MNKNIVHISRLHMLGIGRGALLLILLFPLVLSGCFATKPPYKDPPEAKGDDVLMVLFRPDSQSNGSMDSLFYLNDINVAKLSRNEYTWLHVPEGSYVLKHAWQENQFDILQTTINLKKGNVYFYVLGTSNLNGNIRWFIGAKRHEDVMSALHNSDYSPAINMDRLQKN